MPAVPTIPVDVTATDGSIVTLSIPADCAGGNMPVPPTDRAERIVAMHQNPQHWKLPVRAFGTGDYQLAQEVGYCLDWYHGGHEQGVTMFGRHVLHVVSSRGYYHYVGG